MPAGRQPTLEEMRPQLTESLQADEARVALLREAIERAGRTASAYARFEAENRPRALGLPNQRGPVHGKQRLVGCHHMLSMFNGLQNKGFGRFNTTDKFHDNADFRVGEYIVGILGKNYSTVTGNVVRQRFDHDIGNFSQPD